MRFSLICEISIGYNLKSAMIKNVAFDSQQNIVFLTATEREK